MNIKHITGSLLLAAILLTGRLSWAESGSKVSGIVIGAAVKTGIEDASVSLLSNGKVIDGVLTDVKGHFVLRQVAPGPAIVCKKHMLLQ